MTAGYLTALANRALGGAPELQPPVPSRFEPEGPRAELAEFIRISDSEAPPDDAGIVAEKRPAPITEPGQRLRGAYEPDTVSEGPAQSPAHGNWPALDARHNPAEPRAEARRVPRLPAEIPDDARSSYERLTSHAAAGGTGLLLPGALLDTLSLPHLTAST